MNPMHGLHWSLSNANRSYIVQACFTETSFRLLFSWLTATGLVGFFVMGVDKSRAINHEWRIPETALFVLSYAGGFWGVLLSGFMFHHKTSKPEFLLVVLPSLALWFFFLQGFGFVRCLMSAL